MHKNSSIKLSIIFFTFITLVNGLQSQTINGKILDAKQNLGIAYVNIGILGKNIGTVSDEQGKFTLDITNTTLNDTLKLSMIGYQTLVYCVGDYRNIDLSKTLQIQMQPKTIDLKEVIISSNLLKEQNLGNKCNRNFISGGFSSNDLGSELGTVIRIKKSPTYIKAFSFYITKNTFDSLFFRLNIYNMNDGKPSENILHQNIYLSTCVKNGQVEFDLSSYNLSVSNDFFISLEWIRNYKSINLKDGLYFSGGIANNTSYYRKTSQGIWEKVPAIGIGFNVDVKQ